MTRRFELVVANILGHILLTIQDDLVARCTADGKLLICGVVRTEADEFVASFAPERMECVARRTQGDWAALLFEPRHA